MRNTGDEKAPRMVRMSVPSTTFSPPIVRSSLSRLSDLDRQRSRQPAASGHAHQPLQVALRHARRLLQVGDVGLDAADVGVQIHRGEDHGQDRHRDADA